MSATKLKIVPEVNCLLNSQLNSQDPRTIMLFSHLLQLLIIKEATRMNIINAGIIIIPFRYLEGLKIGYLRQFQDTLPDVELGLLIEMTKHDIRIESIRKKLRGVISHNHTCNGYDVDLPSDFDHALCIDTVFGRTRMGTGDSEPKLTTRNLSIGDSEIVLVDSPQTKETLIELYVRLRKIFSDTKIQEEIEVLNKAINGDPMQIQMFETPNEIYSGRVVLEKINEMNFSLLENFFCTPVPPQTLFKCLPLGESVEKLPLPPFAFSSLEKNFLSRRKARVVLSNRIIHHTLFETAVHQASLAAREIIVAELAIETVRDLFILSLSAKGLALPLPEDTILPDGLSFELIEFSARLDGIIELTSGVPPKNDGYYRYLQLDQLGYRVFGSLLAKIEAYMQGLRLGPHQIRPVLDVLDLNSNRFALAHYIKFMFLSRSNREFFWNLQNQNELTVLENLFQKIAGSKIPLIAKLLGKERLQDAINNRWSEIAELLKRSDELFIDLSVDPDITLFPPSQIDTDFELSEERPADRRPEDLERQHPTDFTADPFPTHGRRQTKKKPL